MSKKDIAVIISIIAAGLYGLVGTSGNVEEIKERAPEQLAENGFEVIRYGGFQYGSFANHGGKVWYHIREKSDHSVRYRAFVTMWAGELQYYYNDPEKLHRIDIQHN